MLENIIVFQLRRSLARSLVTAQLAPSPAPPGPESAPAPTGGRPAGLPVGGAQPFSRPLALEEMSLVVLMQMEGV